MVTSKVPRLIVSNNLNNFVAGPEFDMIRNERKRFARPSYVGGINLSYAEVLYVYAIAVVPPECCSGSTPCNDLIAGSFTFTVCTAPPALINEIINLLPLVVIVWIYICFHFDCCFSIQSVHVIYDSFEAHKFSIAICRRVFPWLENIAYVPLFFGPSNLSTRIC